MLQNHEISQSLSRKLGALDLMGPGTPGNRDLWKSPDQRSLSLPGPSCSLRKEGIAGVVGRLTAHGHGF